MKLAVAIAILLAPYTPAAALGSTHVITSRTLGVRLILPAAWQRVPAANVAAGTLAFSLPTRSGTAHASWILLVEGLARTRLRDPGQAARAAACALTAGLRVKVRQTPVRYAGVPDVQLTGMPGEAPTIQTILAHSGALYDVVASGASLDASQRQALASLRFLPRAGTFPAMQPRLRLRLRLCS